jgi:hypothetical protein
MAGRTPFGSKRNVRMAKSSATATPPASMNTVTGSKTVSGEEMSSGSQASSALSWPPGCRYRKSICRESATSAPRDNRMALSDTASLLSGHRIDTREGRDRWSASRTLGPKNEHSTYESKDSITRHCDYHRDGRLWSGIRVGRRPDRSKHTARAVS